MSPLPTGAAPADASDLLIPPQRAPRRAQQGKSAAPFQLPAEPPPPARLPEPPEPASAQPTPDDPPAQSNPEPAGPTPLPLPELPADPAPAAAADGPAAQDAPTRAAPATPVHGGPPRLQTAGPAPAPAVADAAEPPSPPAVSAPAPATPVRPSAPAPQLPPLRMESTPPTGAPPQPISASAAQRPAAIQPPSAPPPPADIRISAPAEQALSITLVAASPDLRDRIAAARPELRADLTRIGAEVDLIAVELRGPQAASGSDTCAGSSAMGHQQPGGEAMVMEYGQAMAANAETPAEFPSSDGQPSSREPGEIPGTDAQFPATADQAAPANGPQADAPAEQAVPADADLSAPAGGTPGDRGSRHPAPRHQAPSPEPVRRALPAAIPTPRTADNRIDRYA